MKTWLKICFIICLIGIEPVCASPYFWFKKYTVENGLSNNTVQCAIQDSYGFIWLGTGDGLNCYDGQRNTIFRNMLNDRLSFENNYISSLFEEGHQIWIGAYYGLYTYDPFTNQFTRFKRTTRYGVTISSEVKKIVKARNGLIWMATLGQGVFVYNPKTGVLTQNSIRALYVCDICMSGDACIYLSTMQGDVLCYSQDGRYLTTYKIADYSNNKNFSCIRYIGRDVWVGLGHSLYRFDRTKRTFEEYDADSPFGSIRCLLNYTSHEILVGTDKGLYTFDTITKLFRRKDNPGDSRSLSDQTINAMMWDKEGSLWVMTNLGGVNYMSIRSDQFNYYSFLEEGGNANESEKVIEAFCEAPDGNIWIGTQNGLFYYSPLTRSLTPYGGNRLDYDIRSLMFDGKKLWVGTYNKGLYVMDIATGNIKTYKHSEEIPYTICSNDVYCLYKDKAGEVYVGTSWGLCRYIPQSDKFLTMNQIGSMTSISDIKEDTSDFLWIATENLGVFRLDQKKGYWAHFVYDKADPTSLSSNSIVTLFLDSRKRMWYGTNGAGLCYFNPESEKFINFDPNNNILPYKVIYAIEEDSNGNFWISSNLGLTRINPITKKNFHQYTLKEDLLGSQFTRHAAFRSSKGEMYFGGINGFNAFYPEKLSASSFVPPVYITGISFPYAADEQEEKVRRHLDRPLYTVKEITIPYSDNSFILHFVSLSYENPSKIRYSYILEGADKEWVHNTESNVASYTNLPPGKYHFVLRGSNSDSKWSTHTTSLWIIITPPWYRSIVAYLCYFVLLVFLIFKAAKAYNIALQKKYNRRMDDYKLNQEKEVYKTKIEFFINLVHEIRTPLSLIRLPLDKMKDMKQNADNTKYLSVVDKNVNYLLDVTNQLLDFQKMESGALQMNVARCDIGNLLQLAYDQFVGLMELQSLTLTIEKPSTALFSAVDKDKIEKILVNLLGNALKYARTAVKLRLEVTGDSYRISVIDDGPGIPVSEQGKIFETFYQAHGEDGSFRKGTGIGLSFAYLLAQAHHGSLRVENVVPHGSSFILTLPIVEGQETTTEQQTSDIVEEKLSDNVPPIEQQGDKIYTVLLVEDNVDLLNMTKESLQKWYKVLKAYNGREALQLLSSDNVDVIVSDVMMPEMNGLELCNRVKSDIDYSHIPIILLTAKTTIDSKVEGLKSGADVYIEKPFSISQLHLQIENLLRLRVNFHKMMNTLSGNPESRVFFESGLTQKDCELAEKMQKALSEHIADENFSVDMLAGDLNMSRSSFYRKIKALSGLSPNDYMKTVRLNRAAEMIAHGERISEVSEKVGFTSSSYFAKCFKAQFDVLPKDYLATLRSTEK